MQAATHGIDHRSNLQSILRLKKQDNMQGIVRRRIEVVGNHFDVHQRLPQQQLGTEGIVFSVEQLQKLLEHDNWDTRAKLKELTKQDIFIP